jgi:hypothetical protein
MQCDSPQPGSNHHMIDFRASADFQEWRKLVGHCFATPPVVDHVREVIKAF